MNRVQIILMMTFVTGIAIALAAVVAGEMNWLPVGEFQGNETMEFWVLTVMELLTIALIPLALRLFKFKKVKREIAEKREEGLLKWGLLRLDFLLIPMVVNTALYYLFVNNSFGIMAIIFCLSLVFVYPSKNRCQAELEA